MTAQTSKPVFRPPTDWEAVYAADPGGYTFGEEPSQIARSALRFFRTFGGDPSQAHVLDLGSGEGRDTAYLAAAGCHVTAYEIAPTGLNKTRALLARFQVPPERVQLRQEDVRDGSCTGSTYDIALAANVFQFLPPGEVPAQIERLQGITRPGGLCAVGVFSPAMRAWGAALDGHYAATADELTAFFPEAAGWLLLDRTEYWTYRIQDNVMVTFAYVVARKGRDRP